MNQRHQQPLQHAVGEWRPAGREAQVPAPAAAPAGVPPRAERLRNVVPGPRDALRGTASVAVSEKRIPVVAAVENPPTTTVTGARAPAETAFGASPLFTHVWPYSDELNAQLRQVIRDRMAVSPGLKKSNCGGWQSERNLQLWGGAAIEEVLERMGSMLREV